MDTHYVLKNKDKRTRENRRTFSFTVVVVRPFVTYFLELRNVVNTEILCEEKMIKLIYLKDYKRKYRA